VRLRRVNCVNVTVYNYFMIHYTYFYILVMFYLLNLNFYMNNNKS
jgi:hypothetical protein